MEGAPQPQQQQQIHRRPFGSNDAIVASDTCPNDAIKLTKFQLLPTNDAIDRPNSNGSCDQSQPIRAKPNDDVNNTAYLSHADSKDANNFGSRLFTINRIGHEKDDSSLSQQCFCLNNNEDMYLNVPNDQQIGRQGKSGTNSNGSGKNSNGSSKSINSSSNNSHHPNLFDPTKPEPFQIVWRKLTYEISLRSFECSTRFLRRHLSCWKSGDRDVDADGQNGEQVNGSDAKMGTDGSKMSSAKNHQSELVDQVKSTSPINKQSNKRVIFENLNGYARSGEITAILGPSGAGKTSLLNAICGRTANYKGSIQLIGGRHKKHMQLSIIPQKDYLMENLTVRENLLYSSRILNVGNDFNHDAKIMAVVKMLNLVHCFNSPCRNLSGGEYKRVSIAQELLRQPDILVLDEPTSGLDSLNCKNLINSLAGLIDASRKGKINPIAIIMTIHQPDIDVYSVFDHVYCIARKGRVIFDGHPSDTMEVLRSRAGFTNMDTPNVLKKSHDDLIDGNNQKDKDKLGKDKEDEDDYDADNDTDSIISLTRQQSSMIGLNPANLLIEIASELIYGQVVINRLAAYQRKQFEHYTDTLSLNMSQHSPTVSLSNLSQESPKGSVRKSLIAEKQQHIDQKQVVAKDSERGKAVQIQTKPTLQISVVDDGSRQNSNNNISKMGAGSFPHYMTKHLPFEGIQLGGAKQVFNQQQTSISSLTPTQLLDCNNQLIRDKRLDSKNHHKGLFWYHTCILTKRAFLSTFRDPLMTLAAFGFHMIIPFVMYLVYSSNIGKVTGCPLLVRDMSILSLASNDTYSKLERMQEDFMVVMEGATMLFLSMYSFSMCSLAVAALAFPLNMHILLKELRNGWYRLPTYVLAKTISSIPFEILFPVMSLIMIYLILGLPSSYLEWRMIAIATVMALISMISHTQGLILGAVFMDNVQTAIFLAIASTLPQVLLSGFTARIKQMPDVLQYLSWFSQYRYASDLNGIIRYGFGICKCESDTDEYLRENKPAFVDVPKQMKSFFLFYLNDTYQVEDPEDSAIATTTLISDTIVDSATTTMQSYPAVSDINSNLTTTAIVSNNNITTDRLITGITYDFMPNATKKAEILKQMDTGRGDLFDRLAELVTRSFSYGKSMDTCESVRSQGLSLGGHPPDHMVPYMFAMMIFLVVAWKTILYFVVKFKIARRI